MSLAEANPALGGLQRAPLRQQDDAAGAAGAAGSIVGLYYRCALPELVACDTRESSRLANLETLAFARRH